VDRDARRRWDSQPIVAGRCSSHDAFVARLLILWNRPSHLTADDAERWAQDEVRSLLGDDSVAGAALTRLESASPRYGGDWEWLVELEVTGPARDCVERGACAGWLADMRLLGMRPAVVLVGEGVGLEGEGG
jgi:hypothetical protein